MRVLVTGNPHHLSTAIRARRTAVRHGWTLAPHTYSPKTDWDAVLVTKDLPRRADEIRDRTPWLVWDPVDAWTSERRPPADPGRYFQDAIARLQPDAVICSAPTVRAFLPRHVQPIVLPCAPDYRLRPCGDAAGPITYVGEPAFVDGMLDELEAFAVGMHRRLVVSTRFEDIAGSSLLLAVKSASCRDAFHQHCKPTIKVANAAAAAIPVLATRLPLLESLYGERISYWGEGTAPRVPPLLIDPTTWLERIRAIVCDRHVEDVPVGTAAP